MDGRFSRLSLSTSEIEIHEENSRHACACLFVYLQRKCLNPENQKIMKLWGYVVYIRYVEHNSFCYKNSSRGGKLRRLIIQWKIHFRQISKTTLLLSHSIGQNLKKNQKEVLELNSELNPLALGVAR